MDFLVFSHLRWDFVYQRPQHLFSRAADSGRVFFWEEPVLTDKAEAHVSVSPRLNNLFVVVPQMPDGLSEKEASAVQRRLLDGFIAAEKIEQFVAWYYTPMALNFSRRIKPKVTVYDCMDQLSAFRGAPPGLTSAEEELFRRADVVFTGGQSLYERKRELHHNVHSFPSSIDLKHFASARRVRHEPADQAGVASPKAGFAGVIDERFDTDLLRGLSRLMPEWQFVIIGPVVKISKEELPVADNIHYLGAKPYSELPAYMSGWDVGLLPFSLNESTRFISPTKTPEYLAAGLPVVSTPIRDVVRPYKQHDLVSIAQTPEEFAKAIISEVGRAQADRAWRERVDEFLMQNSWDLTWQKMHAAIEACVREKKEGRTSSLVMKRMITEHAF